MQDKIFMHLLPQTAKDYVGNKHHDKIKVIAGISDTFSPVANP